MFGKLYTLIIGEDEFQAIIERRKRFYFTLDTSIKFECYDAIYFREKDFTSTSDGKYTGRSCHVVILFVEYNAFNKHYILSIDVNNVNLLDNTV